MAQCLLRCASMSGTVSGTTSQSTVRDQQIARAREAAAQARRVQAQQAQRAQAQQAQRTQTQALQRQQRTLSTPAAKPDLNQQDSYTRAARPPKASDWMARLGSTKGEDKLSVAWPAAERDIKLGAEAGTS